VTGRSGVEAAIEKSHEALAAIITGDAAPFLELFSKSDDATLANPWGPPVRGFVNIRAAAERAASFYKDGEIVEFERISDRHTAEFSYMLEIERCRAKLPGEEEFTDVALRVTSIFRPEDDEWKLVHRHADLITTPRGPESIPRRA
jgi:ketosteroid isomerase-like protein